uniref:Methyltransferase-like protein 2-A n=1 Tax=Romanomermis culicivorax TaxID=13658 RepID=A0A915KEX7_ROMCU
MLKDENFIAQNDDLDQFNRKRPQFGGRFLNDESEIFQYNAWDDVEWNDEQKFLAQEKIQKNCSKLMPEEDSELLENRAEFFWDEFYATHKDGFFKDRNWLFTEFPELKRFSCSSSEEKCQNFQILEVGCGVGNTIFPILEAN